MRDYRYVTEGTFDAYSYQTVERKQRFISQLMSSKSPAREAADLDADVVTLANIKALATGDPDIQRRMTLENEINQLKLLRASWAQQKADTRRDINQQLQPRIEGIRQAIREKTDDKPLASKALNIHQTARMNGKWEGMTINGRPVGDRQTACSSSTRPPTRRTTGTRSPNTTDCPSSHAGRPPLDGSPWPSRPSTSTNPVPRCPDPT